MMNVVQILPCELLPNNSPLCQRRA